MSAKDLEESLSLKELIHAVRDELVASELERVNEGKRPLFEFDTLDIEVHFVVTKSRSAKGGFSLKVLPFVPFGADAQITGFPETTGAQNHPFPQGSRGDAIRRLAQGPWTLAW